MIETFVAPRRLVSHLREVDPAPWLDVLLLTTVVTILAAAMQPGEVFLEQMQDPVNRRGQPVEITSPPSEVVRYGRYLAAMSAAVGHPMIALGLAGTLTLLFGLLGRGEVPFTRYLSLVSHGLLIPAAGVILVLFGRLALESPLETNLAALAPNVGASPGVREILRGIDVFHVWMLLVLAAGVSVLDRRSELATAAVLLGVYLAANLATAALP